MTNKDYQYFLGIRHITHRVDRYGEVIKRGLYGGHRIIKHRVKYNKHGKQNIMKIK